MARKVKEENAVLPPVVKINGYNVSVRPMAGNEQNYTGAGGIYNFGQVSLALDSPPQLVAMCLVHELLHACFDYSGLRWKYHDVDGKDLEEEIVSSLAFSITQLIANEEDLVKFVRDAFNGKNIEVPPECMQIPISGNWTMSESAGMQAAKTKKADFIPRSKKVRA